MNLSLADIYPLKIAHGNLSSTFTRDEFISIQDAIENTSHETHDRLNKPQSLPAVTDDGLFLHPSHKALVKMKEVFYESCIEIHEAKFPHLKGKFNVYDSVCKGLIINSKTTVQDTMSNYPWHYTGIAIVRAPDDLPPGQGDIVFIDPLPVSEKGDAAGITAKIGNMTIFPSWLKYRLRPIAFQEHQYDTVMMLVMNAFVVHDRLEDYEARERNKSQQLTEAPAFQLGPTGEWNEVELGVQGGDQKPGEFDIGRF
jgi:hypothetical protein